MKQLELISKRAKPKCCNWILLGSGRECKAKAVIMIHGGAYCSVHAAEAQKYFGQGKPIYA
jgi:hypothetical protein